MRKKIFIPLIAVMAMMLGVCAYADEPAEGPADELASVSDGLLIDGEQISEESEYLETWQEQEEPALTHYASASGSLYGSVVGTDGKYNGYDVYTAEEAAEYCIDLIKDHVETIDGKFLIAVEYDVSEIGSSSPYTYAFNAYSAAFAEAFDNSLFVDGKGGDYILYSMYGRPFYATSSCKYFTDGDEGLALIYATPGKAYYYTTAAQEQEFAQKAASVVSSLKASAGSSDYDKVCAVFDYICDNVAYDYDHLGTSDYYTMYTAYGALCDGQAVCQGYANLFYYLCNEMGVPCRIVAGTGYTGAASGPHAWNIVKLDGAWYHVDATWGASYSQWYKGRYFFLQSEANFLNGHNGTGHEMDYMTGLIYIDYTGSDFLDAYPISATKDYCSHDYALISSRAASCGVYGYEVYKCSICGETYEETLDKLEHRYTEIVKEATCTEPGEVRCVNCKDVEPTAALGHDYVKGETTPAGCVTDGYTEYVCSRCGNSRHDDITSSLGGHSYTEQESVPMSHGSDGYTVYKCAACGDEYTDIVPSVANHVFDAFTVTEDSKESVCGPDYTTECAICGHTEYVFSDLHEFEPLEKYTDTDGNEYEDCEVCRYCGLVVYENDGDTMIAAYDDTLAAGPCDEHAEETIDAVEATCTRSGHAAFTRCSVCGVVTDGDPEFTEPSGHSEAYYDKEATCTENGHTGVIYCEVCHEIISSGKLTEAHGHDIVTVEAMPASCTEDGVTRSAYCRVCGDVEEEAEPIPATGHDVFVIEAVEPTCTEEGSTVGAYCTICGEEFEESVAIPANGHNWTTQDRGLPAACTEDGRAAVIACSVCGAYDGEYDGRTLSAGHHLTHFEYTEPTEYDDGTIECWYCYDCDTFFLDEAATQKVAFADTVLTASGSSGSGNDGTASTGNTKDAGTGSQTSSTGAQSSTGGNTYTDGSAYEADDGNAYEPVDGYDYVTGTVQTGEDGADAAMAALMCGCAAAAALLGVRRRKAKV